MNWRTVSTSVFSLIFILATVFSSSPLEANSGQWVALDGSDSGSQPSVTVLESNSELTVIDVSVPGFWVTEKSALGEEFKELSIPGQHTTMDIGKPALPVIRFLVAVPVGAEVELAVQAESRIALENYLVYPFQQPLTDAPGSTADFTIEEEAYRSIVPYPGYDGLVGDPAVMRDLRVVLVEVSPVKYVAANEQLVITPHVVVTLSYQPENDGIVLDNSISPLAPRWERRYRQQVVNFDWLETSDVGIDQNGPAYLIITHPDFESAIQPLALWHHKEGLETELVTINTSSSQAIKDEIETCYDQGNLEYVLLVGDVNYLPEYYWIGSLSDYWYACITGAPDYYADVAVGRLSATTSAQVENQVAKILTYEKEPPLDDWLTKTILAAHRENAPGKYVECKEYIRNYIISQPLWDVQTAYGHQPTGTNAAVSAAINDGCNVVNYRGHGSSTNWWQWDYNYASFTTVNVGALTNGDRTPIVFNIACDCHQIQSTCLGEYWLNQYPGGAVASLGASDPSYTVVNHDYDKELYRQFNQYDEYSIGWIGNAAATLIVNLHGSWGQENARMYFWLGDPATEVWTGIPEALTVDHPAEGFIGTQDFEVTVTDGTSPIEGATVCLYKNSEVYEVGTTGINGVATFTITPSSGGTMFATVSNHNNLPYEGEVTILDELPNVALALTPDAGSFPQGGELGYTVQGTNNEPNPVTMDYWGEVFLPNGNPWSGNPVFGPISITLPGGASPSAHLTHFIPGNTPLWTFTYKASLGVYGGSVWAEDSFDFTITE